MSRPVIVVGDRTSHGGVVITGSPFSDVDGKAIARIGDQVTCPQKGHGSVTTIVTGDLTAIVDGNPVARHGDKTACGVTLISNQTLTYVDEGGSSGRGASSTPAAASAASSFVDNEAKEQQKPYDEQPFCGLPTEPESVTGKDWGSKIKSRSGIIYFENYWRRQGETTTVSGDHIDLWNGSNLTPNAVNYLRRLGLNSVQWLPSLLSDFNYSDLGNSTKILFWEIK